MAMCMITGIPECGKTVLLSTLVLKRREVFFPKNREAQKFEEEAKQLEMAAKDKNVDVIESKHDIMIEHFEKVINDIRKII